MQTLRTSIRRKAASTPDLESRAHPYDPHRHAACQHGRRGLGTSQGKSTHQPTSVASTLQRSWQAPCSEVAKHPAAKSRSTLQRSREAPCSEVAKHPAAKLHSTLQRRRREAPRSEAAKHSAAKSPEHPAASVHPYTIRFMRVVNRTAVTITGAKPYIDWMRRTDADFTQGAVSVPRVKAYGSAFLLPEFGLEEDLQEWVEENAPWLFEFQLAAWTEIEAAWPPTRDLKTFREWFRIDIHSVVVDVGDDDIEGEEL